MKVHFHLKDSILDCRLELRCSNGAVYRYLIAAPSEEQQFHVTVDVPEKGCQIALIPIPAQYVQQLHKEFENSVQTFADKLAKKAGDLLLKTMDKGTLKVGCTYLSEDLRADDHVDISLQAYAFGGYGIGEVFDLLPLMCLFYVCECSGKRLPPHSYFAFNRKAVIRSARSLAAASILGDGLLGLLAYPFQVGRIKRLSKDRKLQKTLLAFHNMSPAAQRKLLQKMDLAD